eukprot:15365526-Ditylum_brightwellii.AAC.2
MLRGSMQSSIWQMQRNMRQTSQNTPTGSQPNRAAQNPHTPPAKRLHWPTNLLLEIEVVIKILLPNSTPPKFAFQMTAENAERNFCILQKHNFNPHEVIETQKDSQLGYGSEF